MNLCYCGKPVRIYKVHFTPRPLYKLIAWKMTPDQDLPFGLQH